MEDCFIILSVIGQISIDLAKKSFDIDVVKEINRIKRLQCMNSKKIPRFLTEAKKVKNSNKKFDEKLIKKMNCPMDIMADIIEKNTISYADRVYHKPIRKFFNSDIKGKGNRYKQTVFLEEVDKYNQAVKNLEIHKEKLEPISYAELKNRMLSNTLTKVNKNLDI